MAKKKNSRKMLAVALGIMGIAGLSLASASQLNITATPANIAVGTGAFTGSCDDAVDVNYNYDLPTKKYTSIVISGIDAKCSTKQLEYTVTTSPAIAGITATVTVPTVVTPATSTVTITSGIAGVALTTGLTSIDVAIY